MDTIFAEKKPGLATALALAERYGARNYEPLPVVLERGEGVWVWDGDGKRYLDCLSGYSAVSQGHRHPRIVAALIEQAGRLTLTSRAFHNDRLGSFLAKLCRLAGMQRALPMNTGAEAVETAIKAMRKWGHKVKGIADGRAEIIVAEENFHGRTTTIVGFSSEAQYRDGFGPFAPGFIRVPFGDAAALEAAIGPDTAGVLLEPIQGEAGVRVPPDGYLAAARDICDRNDVLLAWDEVQTGLGRTGTLFCHQHERDALPDLLLLGKALGGGVYPVSAVVGSEEALGVFRPGDHGSTFGGNPLAAAVGEASLDVIVDEDLPARSAELGAELIAALREIRAPAVKEIRGRGLFVGIELDEAAGPARPVCERLLAKGLLTKDTHRQVIRLAPPLVIRRDEIAWALGILRDELQGI
jgi:ornithine--oxo-acid transaminase